MDAGTFYSSYYGDADRVFTLFDAYCWMGQMLLEESLDAAKMFYRQQIPPLHRDLFYPITISEQDYREGVYKVIRYGEDGLQYGQGLHYGIPDKGITGAIPLPAGLVDIDLCVERPVEPSVLLLKNIDFEIRGGYLILHKDIFDIFTSEGQGSDRECTFWLRSAYFDRRYIQDRLGILTRTYGYSTRNYLEFCNLIMDSVIEGTSEVRLTQILCKLFDVPCTEETEIVELVDDRSLVTDRRVYFAAKEAKFLYKAGDIVPPGTILTDAITVTSQKHLPEGMPLFLERRFLGRDYLAGLYFPNEFVRVQHTADSRAERATVRFPIVGRAEDVERFWTMFHERDLSSQLSNAFAGDWVNPAEFIYETVLYPRLRIFQIEYGKTGSQRLPMANTQILRSLLPPGVLFSLQMAMPPAPEPEIGVSVSGVAGGQGVGMKPVILSPAVVLAGSASMRAC